VPCLCVISRTPRTISSRLAPGGKSKRTSLRRGGGDAGSAGGFGDGAGVLSCGEVIASSAMGVRKFRAGAAFGPGEKARTEPSFLTSGARLRRTRDSYGL